VNSEITKIKEIEELQGWLLYDGECAFCTAWAARLEPVLTRRGFDLAPWQSPWVHECLDLSPAEPFTEIRLVTVTGAAFAGADAFIHLARRVWWAWPFHLVALLPGIKPVLRAAYRWLAARRHCLGQGHSQCRRPEPARANSSHPRN
jgi:predicted DCC family thiol-disulfide oxidoreductase YuxK